MISVSANESSRADLKGCPKFGPFLKPKFNSDFDRFFGGGEIMSPVRHVFLDPRSIREWYAGPVSGLACEPSSFREADPCIGHFSREMDKG